MNQKLQLKAIQDYVKTLFQNDVTGHDFYHMQRVHKMARTIALKEDANIFICQAAALVHDVGDHKLFANPSSALDDLRKFLASIEITQEDIDKIMEAIETVSFSKGRIPTTLEGKIVQDADRIDAIGAIGIARTFAYGGANNQFIYDTQVGNTSIQHFYDKLLKLKDLMHTDTARQIANKRHEFMETFLDQFLQEWE